MRFDNKTFRTQTYVAPVFEYGRTYRLEAHASLRRLGMQRPYLSVTGELWRATKTGERDGRFREWEAGGCLHDRIAKKVPALAALIRWHLSDADGVPMHYIENALYHVHRYLGLYRIFATDAAYPETRAGDKDSPDDCLAAFHASIVWGAAPSDARLAADEPMRNAKTAVVTVLSKYGIDATDRETLKRTRILPALYRAASEAVRNALVPWLEFRRPELRTAFRADVAAVGLDPDAALAEHAAYVESERQG